MGNVFRCYVEKKPGFAVEAEHLFGELRHTLGLTGLTGVRVLRRYDVEGVDAAVYAAARTTVLSEPQVDALWDEVMPAPEGEHTLLAVEALPGQYDQRADSCAQCIQMMHGGERPTVRAATVYVLEGALTTPEAAKARGYLINPVESREAALDKPATLRQDYPVPAAVPVLDGFTALDRAGLESVLAQYALAMDLADLAFLQAYFRDEEGRDPTLTEVRVVDTYWSDHCRHTTFSTHIDNVRIDHPEVQAAYERYLAAREEVYGPEKAATRPQTLMDIATIGAKTLKKRLEDSGSVFQSSSDTEVLIHLIRRKVRMPFIEALKASLNEVKGGFTFLLMTNDTLYAALDPNGFRPLVLGQMDNGSYVVASESCALDAVHAKLVRDVQPGELIIINKDGIKIDYYTTETQLAVCSMEYIYFARPDSIIHGVNIHTARKRMGMLLAKEQPAPEEADMVIGVPNSSLSAATGYAEAAGLPYEMGLIKNQYIARTFIQPTQALREQGVKMKLAPVRGVVSGKNIVVVDDSIVRGTTSRQIVQMLKEAGAKSVHMRIASPPFKYPHFYGIDISERKDLMAAKYSVSDMCKLIGADSLGFLSIPSLIKAVDMPDAGDAPNGGLTVAYFDGKYPTPLYDYEEQIKEPLNVEPVEEILKKQNRGE